MHFPSCYSFSVIFFLVKKLLEATLNIFNNLLYEVQESIFDSLILHITTVITQMYILSDVSQIDINI